jgi:hypothetical protein
VFAPALDRDGYVRMENMEAENNPPSSEISEANRATVTALRRIFEPLATLLKPEVESIVVYDAAAQTSVPSASDPALDPAK